MLDLQGCASSTEIAFFNHEVLVSILWTMHLFKLWAALIIWMHSVFNCHSPGAEHYACARVSLCTWQQIFFSSNLQWESRQADFPIMDSCGVVPHKASNSGLYCSAADCSLTLMSAVYIRIQSSPYAGKDKGPTTDVGIFENAKSICLYLSATANLSWIPRDFVLKFNLFGVIPLK